jgi:spore coat polysaccharide biosynthesis protein SpsF (cytidylyltransferase family)
MITMLIPSRIDSNRLYGKALMRINGKELLDYVLEACLKAHLIDFVGIITTDRNDDFDIYEKFCSKIFVYRCPEPDYNNVLLRYDLAIREIEKTIGKKLKHIMRVTNDCPLLYYKPHIIDIVIAAHLKDNNDFTHNRGRLGYPSGFDVEIMKRDVIKKALKAATKEELEHVTLHIKNNPKSFKIGEVDAPFLLGKKKYSIDTKEELEDIKKIIELLEV